MNVIDGLNAISVQISGSPLVSDQIKNVTVNQNGSYVIEPDEGYGALEKVNLSVSVQGGMTAPVLATAGVYQQVGMVSSSIIGDAIADRTLTFNDVTNVRVVMCGDYNASSLRVAKVGQDLTYSNGPLSFTCHVDSATNTVQFLNTSCTVRPVNGGLDLSAYSYYGGCIIITDQTPTTVISTHTTTNAPKVSAFYVPTSQIVSASSFNDICDSYGKILSIDENGWRLI